VDSDSAPVLRVRGLTQRYGDLTVIDGLDLDVPAGTAVALVGPNGSGKSTLLRCLTGLDSAAAGTIELDGRPLDERAVATRRALAVVTDDLDFFPDLSVVEHLDLVASAHGVDDVHAAVDEVLSAIGLTAQAGQLPGTLSSGQRRRLALATVFVRPRRLMVLDEPEQRLDTDGVAWLGDRLRADVDAGASLVFASHDPDLVERVADTVLDLGAS
jgi:ABC-2 type transport system ATP-binding protein